jgi:hypothetical protein
VDGSFFRVDGADLESGEDRFVVFQAASEAQAEDMARQQGLLIASVRPATAEDRASASHGGGSRPTFYSIFSDGQPVVAPVALSEPPQEPTEKSGAIPINRHATPLDDGKATPAPPPASRPPITSGPIEMPLASRTPAAKPPAPARPPVAASSRRIPPPPMPKRAANESLSQASPEIAELPKAVDKAEMTPLAAQSPEPELLEEVVDDAPAPSARATSLLAGAVDLRKPTTPLEALEAAIKPAVAEPQAALLPVEAPAKSVMPPPIPSAPLSAAAPAAKTIAPPPVVAERVPAALPAIATAAHPQASISAEAIETPAAATPHAPLRNAPAAGWVATVILSPLGFLAVAGGIAVLVYAMNRSQPADATDIQRLDAHVQMLAECLLGAVLLLGGLLLFVAAGLVYVGGGMRNARQR